ncbi:MAG: hypothetical protein HFI73_04625 [Bacilli bacterium]|jgi:hypothetical protein|nr:hypothetical protein [Bacilli bacterium]
MRVLGKIIEFDNVYLEYPDELINAEEETEAEKEYQELVMNKTQRLSLEELQQKLEETQSLHL